MGRSDNQRIGEEGELFSTHIGGAATLEGVMMRGKKSWAVAVRCEDGSMYVEEHDLRDPSLRPAWMRWPIVRGCVSFGESMMLSYRAMEIAADHIYVDDEVAVSVEDSLHPSVDDGAGVPLETDSVQIAAAGESSSKASSSAEPDSTGGVSTLELLASAGIGILLGVVLFVALPVFVANLLVGQLTEQNSLAWNLVEAALRIVVLTAYVGGVAIVPDMRRLYGYHGAEHQSIHCFEHGLPLTPENAAKFSRLHVRCGTAFLVMTIAVAIVVHSVVPVASWADALGISGILRSLFVFATRLAMLPLVAGLSYEITVKWAGSHPNNPLVKIALWPGLQMQRLTTRTADAGMLECAIEALKRVDARDRTELQ